MTMKVSSDRVFIGFCLLGRVVKIQCSCSSIIFSSGSRREEEMKSMSIRSGEVVLCGGLCNKLIGLYFLINFKYFSVLEAICCYSGATQSEAAYSFRQIAF